MGQEKWDLLATATAFLHTSRMEGFPMSVVEAAALGLPCITSEATNVNGYLRQYNAGIALPDITPQSIATAMHQIDTHQQNNTLLPFAQNARKMAQEAFDIKSIVQQLADAYAA